MSPSPRSSVDVNAHSPSSPFFRNISQRLSKGSTSSRASSQHSEKAHGSLDPSIQVQDARSTKQYLISIVRDDWEYSTNQSHKDDPTIQREASDYRLRVESGSENESPSDKRSRAKDDEPYKFENPDEVGAVVERRRARRRRLLEQELSWNEGLRVWTLRRDSWTGAVPHRPQSKSQEAGSHRQKSFSRDREHKSSSGARGASPTSTPSWPLPEVGLNVTNATAVEDAQPTVVEGEAQTDLHDGPYLPIYPPLLPASHALRSRIKPTAYPTLYSKVVIQGLAPNVPIPLNHMISALVEGWKAEGNWPPQPTEPQKASTRKRGKKGESAFQKWKREQDEKRSAATQRTHDVQSLQEEPDHRGVRKSITGVVKKAFGMGGTQGDDVDRDLEQLGLTFGDQHDALDEPGPSTNRHV